MADESVTTAAHLEAARKRGRRLLAEEAAGQHAQEWVHATQAARDAAILVFTLWAILVGASQAESAMALLFAGACAFALYTGIANALAVAAQLRFWEAELQRERREIREQPDWEREEIRAIYEAKGFQGDILDRIVDTLSADDDRLLKVMLEEELGIFFEQQNHPAVIGLVTGLGSLCGGLAVAVVSVYAPPVGTLTGVGLILAVLAVVRARRPSREAFEVWVRSLLTAGTVAGVGHFLAHGLSGVPS